MNYFYCITVQWVYSNLFPTKIRLNPSAGNLESAWGSRPAGFGGDRYRTNSRKPKTRIYIGMIQYILEQTKHF
jgi:hypothetical protein